MAATTLVEVTQQDIDKALANDSSKCVVATAIARTFPKATHISVDVHAVKFTNGERRYTYLCPYPVAEYIVAFDAGDELHPFKFRLRDDQRMVVQRRKKTSTKLELDRAAKLVNRARQQVNRVDAKPEASEAERIIAQEKVVAAESRQRVIKAEVAARPNPEPQHKFEDVSDEPPMKVRKEARRSSVFKRTRRAYGGRLMRINNDPGPGDFRGPLDIDQG